MTNLVNIKRNLSSEISKLGAKIRKAIIYFETHVWCPDFYTGIFKEWLKHHPPTRNFVVKTCKEHDLFWLTHFAIEVVLNR
jgi:hypothetical protein